MTKCIQTLSLFALTAAAGGCATLPPLPAEQRAVVFVETTTTKKKDAYNAALSYLAKNLGDSNFAIKMKDADAGTIITQIALDCSELKTSSLDFTTRTAVFNLELAAKDNKVRFVFDAIGLRIRNSISGETVSESSVTTAAEVTALKVCAGREKDTILKALTTSVPTNW